MACSVVRDIQRQLEAFTVAVHQPVLQLSAVNIWLAEVPVGVWPWVWRAVCSSAVAAMDYGRASMAAQARGAAASGNVILQDAGNGSVARFWSLLEEVAVSRRLPRAAVVQPFFRFSSEWSVARVP